MLDSPGIKLADLLTKTREILSFTDVPSSVIPCNCKDKAHLLRFLEMKSFSHFSLLPNFFSFLRETGPPAPRRPL